MGPQDWLESEEQFEAFRAQMSHRLRKRRDERVRFLQGVLESSDQLLAEARELRDQDAERQLVECREAAEAELQRLDPERSGVAAPSIALTTAETLEPASADQATPRRTTPEEQREDTGVPPEALVSEKGVPGVRERPADAVDPAPAPSPQPATASRMAASRQAPAGAVTVSASPLAVVGRAVRSWTPRERHVVEQEVERLAGEIENAAAEGDAGLLRLKAIGCRLRRALQELEELGVYAGDAKAVRGALQAGLRDEHGDPYVPALDHHIVPDDPAQWEALAAAYEALIPALEAFSWFAEHERDLKQTETRDLLEGIGAAQQRLFRLLDTVFSVGDEQQKALYAGLRDCAEALKIFLESLHPSTADAELARRADRLGKTYRDLRSSVEKRLAQEKTLAALQDLLTEPSFGARDEAAERLQAVALACLAAGVPNTKPELRNSLLDWEALLEEGEGLEALREEIAKERERRLKKGQASTDDDEDRSAKRLAADVEKMRQELLPHTRGKRCLFIGGHAREEHRQRIQDELKLAALEWPETDRFDANADDLTADVLRSDIVVLLIRFMRKGMKKVSEVCKEQGKPLVRLPRGINAARVITDFHDQLLSRSASR